MNVLRSPLGYDYHPLPNDDCCLKKVFLTCFKLFY